MRIIPWVTAMFGALVVGVAATSVLDEVLSQVARLQPDRESHAAILRTAISIVVAGVAMGLWMWLWMRYVAG